MVCLFCLFCWCCWWLFVVLLFCWCCLFGLFVCFVCFVVCCLSKKGRSCLLLFVGCCWLFVVGVSLLCLYVREVCCLSQENDERLWHGCVTFKGWPLVLVKGVVRFGFSEFCYAFLGKMLFGRQQGKRTKNMPFGRTVVGVLRF